MKIYALRHGETDWNAKHLIQGKTDIPLNDEGRKQAREAAQKLAPLGINLVITSPLTRAVETTKIIVDYLKIDDSHVKVDARLSERDFGDFEGKPFSEVDIAALRRYTDNVPTPNGETIRETAARVFGFLDELVAGEAGGAGDVGGGNQAGGTDTTGEPSILLVVHGHILRTIYWYFNGIPAPGEEESIITENCALYEFDTN